MCSSTYDMTKSVGINTKIGKVMGQAVEEPGSKEAVNGYPNPNNHASSVAGNLLNCWVHGIHFPEKVVSSN